MCGVGVALLVGLRGSCGIIAFSIITIITLFVAVVGTLAVSFALFRIWETVVGSCACAAAAALLTLLDL